MRKRITINRPVEDLYAFWRDFTNMPQLMEYLESVEVEGDISHWKTTGPANMGLAWDVELVEDVPNELIAWRSMPNSPLETSGSVRFDRAPADFGTELTFEFALTPPLGVVGSVASKLLEATPDTIVKTALFRAKALIETGEIPTLKNQPAARNDGRDS